MSLRRCWLSGMAAFLAIASTVLIATATLAAAPTAEPDETEVIAPLDFGPPPSSAGAAAATTAPARPERRVTKTGSAVRRPSSDDPSSPDYRPPKTQFDSLERDKMILSIEKQFKALKTMGNPKAGEGDYYVVGTIDLQDHKAIVDFKAIEGLKDACEAMADFMLGAPVDSVRKWKAYAHTTTKKAAEAQTKIARSQSIEGRIEVFPLAKKMGKRSNEDAFVIGTAELRLATMSADVRFHVFNGTADAANFLIDYIFGAPENTKRLWQVLFRSKQQDDADQFVQELRKQYDAYEQKRAEIAAMYGARSTRRC